MADAIIVAGGSGTRFGAAKQFALLGNIPLYQHALRKFSDHPLISRVILVIPNEDIPRAEQEVSQNFPGKIIALTAGGATRQESVSKGIKKLAELGASGPVLVHDAARPFVSAETITKVIEAILAHGAAISAIPVVDSLKNSKDGFSSSTVPREGVWRAQTPQGAIFEILKGAFESAAVDDYVATDESELLSRIGVDSYIVTGEDSNVKITFGRDLNFLQ